MHILYGRQRFGDPIVSSTDTPLKKVGSIKHLAPSSSLDPYSFSGKIHRLLLKCKEYLISSPPPPPIISASLGLLGKQKKGIEGLVKKVLLEEGASNAAIKKYNKLLSQLSEVSPLSPFLDVNKRMKKTRGIQDQFIKNLQQLKTNESVLLPFCISDNVNIFYVLQKTEKGYSLKIIGCDESMKLLSDVPTKKIAGKEKILSQIAFENIPVSYFTKEKLSALFFDHLTDLTSNIVQIKVELAEIPREFCKDLKNNEDLWVTLSNNPHKALNLSIQQLNSMGSVNTNATSTKAIRKQLDFKLRLITLFDAFKLTKFYLEQDPRYIVPLRHLVHDIAKEACILKAKGYLTDKDIIDIQKELDFIINIIDKAEKHKQKQIAHLQHLKIPSITEALMPITVQSPVTSPTIFTQKELVRTNIREPMPLTKVPITSFGTFSDAEKAIMQGIDAKKILELLAAKIQYAKELKSQGDKTYCMTLAMEIIEQLNLPSLDENSWHTLLTLSEKLELQGYLAQISKLMLDSKTSDTPLPNQAMTLSQLVKFSKWLCSFQMPDVRVKSKTKIGPVTITVWEGAWVKLNQYFYHLNLGESYQYKGQQRPLIRSSYLSDKENMLAYRYLDKPMRLGSPELLQVDAEASKQLYIEVAQTFLNFMGAPTEKLFRHRDTDAILLECFAPQKILEWSKKIENPLLLSALLKMNLQSANSRNIKDSREYYKGIHNFRYKNTHYDYVKGKQYEGLNDVQLKILQIEMDRPASLKVPEAAHDNPQTVLEQQMAEIMETWNLGEKTLKSLRKVPPYSLKREELTDLLITLRKEDPQIEVLAFIKTHPHLLKHSDIRNYLEMVLFDIGNFSFYSDKTSTKTFFSILQEEIKKYQELVKTDSAYYDQLLFLFSIARKASGLVQSLNPSNGASDSLNETLKNHPLQEILKNSSLRQYHHRALFDYLMLKIDSITKQSPGDLFEITRAFFLMQAMPKDPQNIDPNEQDRLERNYCTFANSFKEMSIEQMAPLLDHLCHDQHLPLDSSLWTGLYPIFKNDQYEINCIKGTVTSRAFGDLCLNLPAAIVAHAAHGIIFAGVDKESLVIRTVKKDNLTTYFISDKTGERGSIEAEDGAYRFYKKFPAQEKSFQVMPIVNDQPKTKAPLPSKKFEWKAFLQELNSTKEHHPLRTLAGEALFFDPEHPKVALALDVAGNIRFKAQLRPLRVTDCRGNKESGPYEIQTLKNMEDPVFDCLRRFENDQHIMLFAKNGKVKQAELLRYGLKFTCKDNKLMCEDPNYEGYWIDLNHQLSHVPHALILRHSDPIKWAKVILSDSPSSQQLVRQQKRSFLRNGWLLIKTWVTGKPPALEELFTPPQLLQDSKKTSLQPHFFQLSPYTQELVPIDEKNALNDLITLIIQSKGPKSQALSAFKQLKLTQKDLNKENLRTLHHFLEISKHEDENLASIKIQALLELKRLMGKKTQYRTVSKELNHLVQRHLNIYLKQGRKLDQRLLLSQPQLEKAAKIVKKTDPEFYEEHIRILFLKPGSPLPSFTPDKGTMDWTGFEQIPHKEQIKTGRNQGVYGHEEIPLETLEEAVKTATVQNNDTLTLETGTPILFSETELNAYFTSIPYQLPTVAFPKINEKMSSCEKMAVEKLKQDMEKYHTQNENARQYSIDRKQSDLLKKKLVSLKNSLKTETIAHKKTIDYLLSGADDPELKMAIQGRLQKVASFRDISIALMQKNLKALDLPHNLNINDFETLLTKYYEAESKLLLLQNAEKVLNGLGSAKGAEQAIQANLLYQLLESKRHYSPTTHPNLLVYECFSQQIFKQLEGKNQIELVTDMLNQRTGTFQATTGSGKTTVLSILRGLLQANGTNLVTFKLLPTLFQQSKALFKKHLGAAFDKKIYSLEFTLKTSLVISEKRKDEIIKSSVFKKIYSELMETIANKGCLLTDYKSIPLLQEKFIKLNREFLAKRADGLPIPDIEQEHWTYLRKILVLLKEKEETCMDEFDVPNRSCNQLQIPLGRPIDLPPFLYEKSLELYEYLKGDPKLKLSLDQQREVSDETRKEVIHDLSKKLAGDNEDLYHYFLGVKDIDLSRYPKEQQDIYALYKDQLTIFLPLTLHKASGLDYVRNGDGTRTIPCHEGEPHENSKPGHPLEEINQTIQDYIANGVSLTELKTWIRDLQDEALQLRAKAEDPISCQQQFQEIFPGQQLPEKNLSEEALSKYLLQLNQNWTHVKSFLLTKMKTLKVSGEVISMNPHNSAAMTKSVCGLSATLGCVEELPKELQGSTADESQGNPIMGEMLYRLIQRTGNNPPVSYDAEKPFEVLSTGTYHAQIDGAGIFRSQPPKEVATQFKESQKTLAQVAYPDGEIAFVGEIECPISQKGFYFPKAKCRGLDITLDNEAIGLLTVDRQKTLEDLAQNGGRLRKQGQTMRLARSNLCTELTSTEAILIQCARNSGMNDSPSLFRSKMQQIPHVVRQAAYEQLIHTENLNDALNAFDKFQHIFIQKPVNDYNKPGSYAKQNAHVRRLDHAPGQVLTEKKQEWLAKAKNLGLSVPYLEKLEWSEDTLKKMPENVAGIDDNVELGLEIEEEVEVEQDVELEMDMEMEREIDEERELESRPDIPSYPPWIDQPKLYQASQGLFPFFDPRIIFTENFLPIERKDTLFKRSPFDPAMPKVRVIHMCIPKGPQANANNIQFILGDALEDVRDPQVYAPTNSFHRYSYDIRTRRFIDYMGMDEDLENTEFYDKELYKIVAQVKFMNGEYDGYSEKEWKGLKEFLNEWKDNDLATSFEKMILKNRSPRKIAGFKHSPLKALFDEIKSFRLGER